MKKLTLSLFFLLIGLSFAQAQTSTYDEALANKLGADDYGMKKYVIAFLYRGDRVDEYSPEQRA